MKTFYWLVKREFWEHRGGFLWTPIIVGGVFLLLQLMSLIAGEVILNGHGGLHGMLHGPFDHGPIAPEAFDRAGQFLDIVLYFVAGLVLMIMAIVVFFYYIGSLYDDRRDRSVLFWKSLPISDMDTVLSKVFSGVVLAPAIACLVGIVAGLLLLLMYSIVATFHGINVWQLLAQAHPLRVIANLIVTIPLYAIWALPCVGWLMLCSAWARSKPFLWALVLPLATSVFVWWFGVMDMFNLSASWFLGNVTGRLLGGIIPGNWLLFGHAEFVEPVNNAVRNGLDITNSYSTLFTPTAWIGAIAGIVMLAAAIWLRRWRDDT